MQYRFTILLLFIALYATAQTNISVDRRLMWEKEPYIHTFDDGETIETWRFDQCAFSDETPSLPVFSERFPLNSKVSAIAFISNIVSEKFDKKPSADDAFVSADWQVETFVEQEGRNFWVRVRMIPVRKTGAGFERLTAFTLNIQTTPLPPAGVNDRNGPFATVSVLSDGDVYKFGVSGSGIYKLDYTFLKNQLGISNLDNIDPRIIKLYGNGGYMVPERVSTDRPDDLLENAIEVSGESDGKFDSGDFILFNAVGPDPWVYRASQTDPQLTVQKHLYDRYAWYFIKISPGGGKRMETVANVPASEVTEQFDDVQRLEEERENLLNFAQSATGSGKKWLGDYFFQTRNRAYSFNFTNIVPGAGARLKAEFAGRSGVSSTVRFIVDGATFSRTINSVAVSNNESSFAANAVLTANFTPDNDKIDITVDYPEVSQQSEGWLDYIELNVRRRLVMDGAILSFRDLQSIGRNTTLFRLGGVSGNLNIWDITTPQSPMKQSHVNNGATVEFGATTKDILRNYIAFADNASFPKPEVSVGKIANQNLHGLDNIEMVIVYHPDLAGEAATLADHRRTHGGLSIELVNVNLIYNEFSSGAKDITAIRDFARMLFERNNDKFEYMLLFGDGSFDPKNNTNSEDNRDLIPVFETPESFNPISAFPSDDFYALLSPEDGATIKGGQLDIAVGRIPARTPEEATRVVRKIIDYETNPATLGDWRLRHLFIADDEDGNPHIKQADKLAIETQQAEDFFNIEKVYFDAYQQVATSAGQRYPDAKSAINSDVFKGQLVMQYVGHGGPRGWAQERVVDQNDIAGWENPNRYPLIITATCSFGGFDDYTNTTGGEQAFLKDQSGAIGLFTTVRAVYIDGNERLTDAVQKVIFKRFNGQYLSIGEILRSAKNDPTVSGEENARRFTLLGDPSMFLAVPEYRVATTKINDKPVLAGSPDTLRALMPVKIDGMVTDTSGVLLSGFNGRVFVTIFDKPQTLQTLGQDPGSYVRTFTVQRNVIFKGSATVNNGLFSVNFVVPKDINYTYGVGKISYYAENGSPLDAAGADLNIIVGGNAGLVQDNQPPVVQPFLNTDAFVFGGITNNDPKVLVKCADDYGMNVSGTSLGHDLTAVLDGNVLETLVLNDFYQSEQDNYRKGQAIYPLRNLTPGKHTLKVKGWDIANNPGEGYTEFIVAEDGKASLAHVLNYPNPFTTNTYFQFEHNLAGQVIDVEINVFSVSGKLVKSIQHSAPADGFRVTDISWNGLDEYGDPLGRGVYIYRVKVRGTDGAGQSVTAESDFERLVILK